LEWNADCMLDLGQDIMGNWTLGGDKTLEGEIDIRVGTAYYSETGY